MADGTSPSTGRTIVATRVSRCWSAYSKPPGRSMPMRLQRGE